MWVKLTGSGDTSSVNAEGWGKPPALGIPDPRNPMLADFLGA
jgi:hypothetical protein